MSERNSAHDDDMFAALAAQLETDGDFANRMEAANGQLDDVDALTAAPRYETDEGPRPYFAESINDLGDDLYQSFVDMCEEHGVDVNALMQSTDDYGDIQSMLALVAYQMKDRLLPGDTVAASSALIIDMRREDDDSMSVIGIPANEKVVGQFSTPVIGPMPDEAFALMGDGENLPPIGVGLRIEQPAIIDEYGETHKDAFDGADVIIALGAIGLHLEKFHFLDEV